VTRTAEVRLAVLGAQLVNWCETQTYRSPRWVYGWNRTDLPDRYRFTITVGAIPATEYEVTEDQLEELTGPDLYALLAAKLEPHELPERNDEL
jgi:hypothetical protein